MLSVENWLRMGRVFSTLTGGVDLFSRAARKQTFLFKAERLFKAINRQIQVNTDNNSIFDYLITFSLMTKIVLYDIQIKNAEINLSNRTKKTCLKIGGKNFNLHILTHFSYTFIYLVLNNVYE